MSHFAAKFSKTPSQGEIPIDAVLLNDLYTEIELRPPAIEARKLLIQHCLSAGLDDAAIDAVKQLLLVDPQNHEGKAWALALNMDIEETTTISIPEPKRQLQRPVPVKPTDTEGATQKLMEDYRCLKNDSQRLRNELYSLRNVIKDRDRTSPAEKSVSKRLDVLWDNSTKLTKGRISTVLRVQQLGSTRSVAKEMALNPVTALGIAIQDLEEFAKWLQSSSQTTPLDGDALREALVKRVRILTAALPDEQLKAIATVAQMHAEHEILKRTYVNDETMYGDQIIDIPRDHFLVTDDGYAWDMEELQQAITSNKGVMRNPLSKQMFTTNDIRAIVQHPLGIALQALQIEQGKLSQGVRPKTIEEMEKMAKILLADMSEDQMTSRHAVDEFMAFVATLPETEIKALEGLRVPAKDSHTGQGFDCSVLEAVKDAQGNRVCIHKTADFIAQAAQYLKKPA